MKIIQIVCLCSDSNPKRLPTTFSSSVSQGLVMTTLQNLDLPSLPCSHLLPVCPLQSHGFLAIPHTHQRDSCFRASAVVPWNTLPSRTSKWLTLLLLALIQMLPSQIGFSGPHPLKQDSLSWHTLSLSSFIFSTPHQSPFNKPKILLSSLYSPQ